MQVKNSINQYLPWVIWLLPTLFFAFNYIQQVFPAVAASKLEASLSANEGALGMITAAYFYIYAFLQIPVGVIFDRFATKTPLFLAIICSATGAFIFSATTDLTYAFVARIMMGAGAAFSFIGCLKLIQVWFVPDKFSTLAGLTTTAGMIGSASGPAIAWNINLFGWRECMVALGIAHVVLAVLVWIFVTDPNKLGVNNNKSFDASPDKQEKSGLVDMLCNRQFLLNAVYATSIGAIFVAFGDLWGSSYIMKYYAIDNIYAADIGSFLFIGAIVGSLFFGWFSDRIKSRKRPMVASGFGAIACFSVMLYTENLPILIFTIILFLSGFFCSANIVSYALARDIYPRFAGLSIGTLNTIFFAGSAGVQQLVSLFLQYRASYLKDGSLSKLSITDYQDAFFSILACLIIGTICSLLIKEVSSKKTQL